MTRYQQAALALEQAFEACLPNTKKIKNIKNKQEWAKSLEQFNGKARSLRLEYRLGWLGRALTAYQFQRNLIAAGHPPEMVRQLVFSMVLSAFVG